MGTPSTYRFIDSYEYEGKKSNHKLAHVYFQYDGYPEGHPYETAKWLSKGKLVNGIGVREDDTPIFNGASCLVAQFIAENKQGAGGVYVNAPQNFGQSWEDYLYDIIVKDGKTITMIAYENHAKKKRIFEGTPQEFVEWVDSNKRE